MPYQIFISRQCITLYLQTHLLGQQSLRSHTNRVVHHWYDRVGMCVGCSMLALAYRDMLLPFQTEENGDEFSAPQLERDLTLLAIIGIEDPMRQEVPTAIEACHRAGISVRMLTGLSAMLPSPSPPTTHTHSLLVA